MVFDRMIVGNYSISGGMMYIKHGPTETTKVSRLYKKFNGKEAGLNGIHVFSNKQKLSITSTQNYPSFTFLIKVSLNMPMFLQIGKGFAAFSNGFYFVKSDGDIEGVYPFVEAKKIDDSIWHIKLNLPDLSGEFYSDGKRLWNKKLGETIEEVVENTASYMDDIIFALDSGTFVKTNGKKCDVVIRNVARSFDCELFQKRIPYSVNGKNLWGPKYYERFIFPKYDKGVWDIWY